jgi:hypothetical protein
MMARWKLKDADDMKKAIKKGLLSEEQVDRAKGVLEQLYQEKETEGFPKTQELWAEYLTSRLPNETYPDWYRRTRLLEKELKGKQLPGPDWVGWHPSVDLEDIKLKIVQDEGKNMYDYDLWPDRARAVSRRPMVAEAAAEVTQAVEAKEDPAVIRARITSVLAANKVQPLQVTLLPSSTGETVVNLEVVDDRSKSSVEEIRRRAG